MTDQDWTKGAAEAEAWLTRSLGCVAAHALGRDPQGRPVAYLRIDAAPGLIVNVSIRLMARSCRIVAHRILAGPPTGQALANAEACNRTPTLIRLYPTPGGDGMDAEMGLPVLTPSAALEMSRAMALLVHAVREVRSGRAPAFPPEAPHPMDVYRRALDWLKGVGTDAGEAPGESGMARTRLSLADGSRTWLELVTFPEALVLRMRGTSPELRAPETARRGATGLNQRTPAGCVVWNESAGAAESMLSLVPMLAAIDAGTLDWALDRVRTNLEVAAALAAA